MKKYFILFGLCFSCSSSDFDPDSLLAFSTYGTCDFYQKVPLIIDPDFSNEEIIQIKKGAKYWEDAIGINLGGLPISEINCSRENSVLGCITKVNKAILDDKKGYPLIYLYMDHIISGNLPINKITAHEIGHYIGLVHVDNEQSIMYYAIESGQIELEISEYDIEIYEEVCVYNQLN
jgi:hypothetical protein